MESGGAFLGTDESLRELFERVCGPGVDRAQEESGKCP